MIDPVRRELIELIERLSETCPDYRLGQMILNLAFLAHEDGEQGLWNLSDEELIAAARQHLGDRTGIVGTRVAAARSANART